MERRTRIEAPWIGRRLAAILLLSALTMAGLAAQTADVSGTYRIRVKANNRYLHEDGNGDKLLSTRYQANDDFTRFRVTRNTDATYKIISVGSNRYWHEHESGDKLISTRYNFDDAWNKFAFERQNDGSYVIRSKGSGRMLHEDGGGDKLLSTRYQPNDDFTRFFLEAVLPPAQPGVFGAGEKGIQITGESRDSTKSVGWNLSVNQTRENIFGTDLGGQLTDLRLTNVNPLTYAYAAVRGNPYDRSIGYMQGYTSTEFNKYMNENGQQPETMHAYDDGSGVVRIVATYRKADSWWRYMTQSTPGAIQADLENNEARPLQFSSYRSNGALRYAVLMVKNTGKRAWWIYSNIPADEVTRLAKENSARLTDLDVNDEGRYNVIMESCDGACPAWWWMWDQTPNDVVRKADELQARPFDVNVYPGCGGVCVAALLVDNSGYVKPRPDPGTAATALRMAHSGLCLAASGSGPGSRIVQENCTANDAAQAWSERYVDSPWALYVNGQTGLCMEPAGDINTNGSEMVQYTCNPNRKEQWFHVRPVNADSDQNTLVPRLSTTNKCADISGISTAPGARLLLWDCTGNSNQKLIRYSTQARKAEAAQTAESFIAQNVLGIEDPDPEICWKQTTTRRGEEARTCPSNYPDSDGAYLCYEQCAPGYSVTTIATCGRVCPAGWGNEPATCRKPGSYNTTGYALKIYYFWWTDAELHAEAKGRCEANEKRACQWRGLLYYPVCQATFAPETLAPWVCAAVCPSGMTDSGFGSCWKPSYIRGAIPTQCAPGTQRDAHDPLGICYPACPGNSTGVGFVCWGGCGSEYGQNCGAACAKSIDACVFSIGEMITETSFMVLNITNMVLTGGGGTPAIKAAQAAARKAGKLALKTAEKAAHKKAAREMLEKGVEHARKNNLKNVLDKLGEAKDAADWMDKMAESLVNSLEQGEFDYRELIPTAADFDPTGILSVIKAFNKPICK